MRKAGKVGGAIGTALFLGWACGGTLPVTEDPVTPDAGSTQPDGGLGTITLPDGGVVLVLPDGGTAPVPDGGTPDAGAVTPLPVTLPQNADGWTFFGPQQGGPNEVYGASLDEGGNLWVAGGEEGLFVLRAGAAQFERFTMAEGLRPFGYMADGTEPPGEKYLKVISVSGAWAGSAFVGYQGKPKNGDTLACEDNWDGSAPDPSIYKSGDADRVTLTPGGIEVVHYDISSGAGIVGNELRGREKVCNILRVRYDKANDRVWFGGNHGFAMGDAHYAGTQKCEWEATPLAPVPPAKTSPFNNKPGHFGCSGVLEHAHPAVSGLKSDGTCCALLTGGYRGVALDPVTKDVWFAGQMRTTRFRYATNGGGFYAAQSQTEDPPYVANRIDIWPDLKPEGQTPGRADRVDDNASGAAAMADGSVWVSSDARGLAQLSANGEVVRRMGKGDGLVAEKFGAVVADPLDQSVWAGGTVAGISRIRAGGITNYSAPVFGFDLANQRVSDLQAQGDGAGRRIVVSFQGSSTKAGAVGIYSGP